MVVCQKDPGEDDPGSEGLHEVGTVVRVHQVARLPDGILKAMVEGLYRARIESFPDPENLHQAICEEIADEPATSLKVQALMRNVSGLFEQATRVVAGKKLSPEEAPIVAQVETPGRLADVVAAHMDLKVGDRQAVLSALDPEERLELVSEILQKEIEIAEVDKRVRSRVKKQMETLQKEYFLREQVKAIQKELGEGDDLLAEIQEYQKKIEAAGVPEKVSDQCALELGRLSKVSGFSAEATVIRNWLDTIIDLPWERESEDTLSIPNAEKILEEDHFGLEEPKERILEYLSVLKLRKVLKGPILCLVGPPGVGKTSIAKSVARAMGREFVRVALGGMHDEAEIRGHRKTYVGAMPGRIMQNIQKANTRNPVFLLDEIDKTGQDWRGDPTSALLEVLDPEQNTTFQDHYLGVPFDLSRCLFIATANLPHLIPGPLRDRMEEISLPGYTVEEKVQIADRYLVPKQVEENGLGKVDFTQDAILKILHNYTREAGVRGLERTIAKVLRKEARRVVEAEEAAASKKKKTSKKAPKKKAPKKKGSKKVTRKSAARRKKITVTPELVREHLGPEMVRQDQQGKEDRVGVVTGLAWTSVGGTLLSLEAEVLPGAGKLMITGNLGEVMQESVQAAVSHVRVNAKKYGLDEDFYKTVDLHVHAPEGAVPKDGPSAGVTISTAVISALTSKKVDRTVAMTGEVTLLGRVLEVGGVKEKLLAAYRAGYRKVLIPEANTKDLEKIPKEILKQLKVLGVSRLEQVLEQAFV
jgi:ATP-dependent Lon protease